MQYMHDEFLKLREHVERCARAVGLSIERMALLYEISRGPERWSTKACGQRLGRNASTITRDIQLAIRDGYVVRDAPRSLSLTQNGRNALEYYRRRVG